MKGERHECCQRDFTDQDGSFMLQVALSKGRQGWLRGVWIQVCDKDVNCHCVSGARGCGNFRIVLNLSFALVNSARSKVQQK